MVAVTSSLNAVQASFHLIICNFSIVPATEQLAIGDGNEYEDLMETLSEMSAVSTPYPVGARE